MPRRRKRNRPLTRSQLDLFVYLFVIVLVAWPIISVVHFFQNLTPSQRSFAFWLFVSFVVFVIATVILIKYLIKRKRRAFVPSQCDIMCQSVYKALTTMDKTANWYSGEEEANKELVSCLSIMGVAANYQSRLPNSRIADVRVGNILIEGKLEPDIGEVDRLLGQLSDYTQYGDHLIIAIYGTLPTVSIDRIKRIIATLYPNTVRLVLLPRATRHRSVRLYN